MPGLEGKTIFAVLQDLVTYRGILWWAIWLSSFYRQGLKLLPVLALLVWSPQQRFLTGSGYLGEVAVIPPLCCVFLTTYISRHAYSCEIQSIVHVATYSNLSAYPLSKLQFPLPRSRRRRLMEGVLYWLICRIYGEIKSGSKTVGNRIRRVVRAMAGKSGSSLVGTNDLSWNTGPKEPRNDHSPLVHTTEWSISRYH